MDARWAADRRHSRLEVCVSPTQAHLIPNARSVSCWLCDADNAQLPAGYTVGTEEPKGEVVGELGGPLSALQDTPSPNRITPPHPYLGTLP